MTPRHRGQLAGPSAQEQLRGIAEAAERATELTRELLTFARRQTLKTERMDLGAGQPATRR